MNNNIKVLKLIGGVFLCLCGIVFALFSGANIQNRAYAEDTSKSYYTIYDIDDNSKVVFIRGEKVEDGDGYISSDNRHYEIVLVDDTKKEGYAKFIKNEDMPVYKISKKISSKSVAHAEGKKQVGLYHTHNDESYIPTDGYDSTYGKGGIHDVGKALKSNLEKLDISVAYSEDLHLPHNSGAYTRSQVTASSLLNKNSLDGLFDIHRDSTPAKEYTTTVDGKQMSKVRMVVGSANQNSDENLAFAKSIKAYADTVYPNLIKDIYIGKGNYNQQLTPRAMLFEMGCENIKKDLAISSTEPLAKTIDVVLYGSDGASSLSLGDVSLTSANGEEAVITGLATNPTNSSLSFLWVLLGAIAFYFIVLGIVCIFSKKARYKTKRFFSELFAGLFVKEKHRA